jgi:hypothetical protein
MDGAVEDTIQLEEAVSLSNSYLFFDPFGTSTTTGNAVSTETESM